MSESKDNLISALESIADLSKDLGEGAPPSFALGWAVGIASMALLIERNEQKGKDSE